MTSDYARALSDVSAMLTRMRATPAATALGQIDVVASAVAALQPTAVKSIKDRIQERARELRGNVL